MLLCIECGLDAETVQHFGDRRDVFECRHLVEQAYRVLSQKRRCDDRQHGILCPADLHAPLEPAAAMYNQLFHLKSLFPLKKLKQSILSYHLLRAFARPLRPFARILRKTGRQH